MKRPSELQDCEACAEAIGNPRTGMLNASCLECSARALAASPAHFDAMRAGVILPRYRDALQIVFGAAWKDGHARVKEWAKRMGAEK